MEIREAIAHFSISHKHTKSPFFPSQCCHWKCAIRFPFKACSCNTCPIWFILPYLSQIYYVTSIKPLLCAHLFRCFCVCDTWHILMRLWVRSNQPASGFLETWPICKTQTHSAWYSLPSSYPILFCHLSTSPHCGNPSQVRTKWVTQGGSQLEHAGPCIKCFWILPLPGLTNSTGMYEWYD